MSISEEQKKFLFDTAVNAASNTYSPYSKYPVGAAILTEDGKIYPGTNVENASFGGTICAERSAIVGAISRVGPIKITAVAVFTGGNIAGYPCGICRQVINEFGPNCKVFVLYRKSSESQEIIVEETEISKLLPSAFGPHNL
jgi:cytidine deaminase